MFEQCFFNRERDENYLRTGVELPENWREATLLFIADPDFFETELASLHLTNPDFFRSIWLRIAPAICMWACNPIDVWRQLTSHTWVKPIRI